MFFNTIRKSTRNDDSPDRNQNLRTTPGWAVLCLVAGLSAPPQALAAWPDQGVLDLAICLDGSTSIDTSEWNLQKSGTADGLEHALSSYVAADPKVRVTVIVFEDQATVELGPTPMDSLATLNSFTTSVLGLSEPAGLTNTADCIDEAVAALCDPDCDSPPRQVIDISTDGDPSTGSDCDGGIQYECGQTAAEEAAAAAKAAGVDELNLIGVGGPSVDKMTAIAFPSPPVDVFYSTAGSFPTTADDGFVLVVDNFTNYVPAINAKILAEVVAAPTLTLLKSVTNDNGGNAATSEWTLTASGTADSFSVSGTNTAPQAILAGETYVLGESGGPSGYSSTGYTCSGAVTGAQTAVTLANNQAATCTITNDDVAPLLTLVKTVSNDNGGSAVGSQWTLIASGAQSGFSLPGSNTGPQAVHAGQSYLLKESGGPAGYASTGYTCSGAVTGAATALSLGVGQSATCTINNDDVGPLLTLIKSVVNDNGGSSKESAWTLIASGTAGTVSGLGPNTGPKQLIANASYVLSETGPAGYNSTGYTCRGDVSGAQTAITLGIGQSATCAVTNDDAAPLLTLVKSVVNDDGGTAKGSDWTLIASGAQSGFSLPGSNTGPQAVHAGQSYILSESGGPVGYNSSGYTCSGAVSGAQTAVTLGAGQSATCTVTNDDVAPTLTLIKEVINDDGGSLDASDFPIILTGSDGTHDSGRAYRHEETPTIKGNVEYTVSENPPAGYARKSIACSLDSDLVEDVLENDNGLDTFTAQSGENVTCTVTNDDVALARFRVTKEFSDANPMGVDVKIRCDTGLILEQEYEIFHDGPGVLFVVDEYLPGNLNCEIFEIKVPDGYEANYAASRDPSGVADTVIPNSPSACYYEGISGGIFTCVISNDAQPGTYTAHKDWVFPGDDIALEEEDYDVWVTITCDRDILKVDGDVLEPPKRIISEKIGDGESVEVEVDTLTAPAFCSATEKVLQSGVEPSASTDCSDARLVAGGSATCTFTNTVFFEGIPTLSQYGLALLALLMLGVGFIGMRRFA